MHPLIEEIYQDLRRVNLLRIANEYRDGKLSYQDFHEDMDAMDYLYH